MLNAQSSMTVRSVVNKYLEHAQGQQSPQAWIDRKAVLREFVATHGDVAVVNCRPHHVLLWVESRPSWRSNWTRRRAVATIRCAFGWAERMGFIDRNPFARTSYEPGERGKPIRPDEFQAMLRASSPVFRRVLIFLRYTGARPGEMATTTWSHFSRDGGFIALERHKTSRRTGRSRVIMLHPVAAKLLDWIERHNPDKKYIFVNAKGRPWKNTAICWRVKQARRMANVRSDVTLYHCRHGFITQAILSGIDIATVAELAGHAHIATTQTYIHLADNHEHLRRAVAGVFKRH